MAFTSTLMAFPTTIQPSCFPAPARIANPDLALAKNESIVIYPNPATDIVNIAIEEDAKLELYNLMGQVVLQQELRYGTNTVDVSRLKVGIYQSRITNNSIVLSAEKMVISR